MVFYQRYYLQRVDFRQQLFSADFLGVLRHHRVDRFFHRGAVGERNALQLAGLFESVELGGVLAYSI